MPNNIPERKPLFTDEERTILRGKIRVVPKPTKKAKPRGPEWNGPQLYVGNVFTDDGYEPATDQDFKTAGTTFYTRSEEGEYTEYTEKLPASKTGKKPNIEPILALTEGREAAFPVTVVADMFTDTRMAAALAQMVKGKLWYWAEIGKYLVFDGQRLTTDAPGGAFPFMLQLIEDLYKQALACSDYAMRCDMLKAAMKIEAHARQESILASAKHRPEIIVSSSQLDQHKMLLTVNNGTINLETGQLQASSAGDFMTRMTSIEYNQNAKSPMWLAFLNRIFDGDKEVIGFIRRFVGYCLTGMTTEQVLVFLYGTGCNGKSVFANVLSALLGDYASTAGADLLMARDNRNATNDIAALRGSRLVKVSEFDDGSRLAEAQIKTLTGGDPVTARFLYHENFTFVPTFKIVLIGNHHPKVRDTGHGIWRRIILVNFDVTIPEDERDPDLQEKLYAELPGILEWAVQGCLEWQQVGLKPPKSVLTATNDYRKAENIMSQWLEECCVRGDGMSALAPVLLKSFIEFSGWRNTTPQKLGRMLSDAGFEKQRTNGNNIWHGLDVESTQQNSHWTEKEDDYDKLF